MHRAPLLAALAAIHGAPSLYAAGFAHSRCPRHEEVRDGAVWIVDCHGAAVSSVEPLQLGEYRYQVAGGDGASRSEWSSRDARMSTIAVDLPPRSRCDDQALERWVRCMEVPRQFAWCDSSSTARFAGDLSFPTYAETAGDMARQVRVCVSSNTTVRTLAPLRAYNAQQVREERRMREHTELAVLGSVLALWFVCGCMHAASGRRYSRV
jgi:hypothetical protein